MPVHTKLWCALPATLVISWALTWYARRLAISRGVLDHPNERSSHSIPTPRGGGFAIVISASIGITVLCPLGIIDLHAALALLVGGIATAAVGFMDDRNVVPVRLRFAVHLAAAVWATYVLGTLPPLPMGVAKIDLGVIGNILAVVAIIWALNLFNFMDGIDGIAACEAVFVLASGAILQMMIEKSNFNDATLVVAAASFGFLVWNWPPAKIFMGDVGSGYLGYVIAVLALAAARENSVMIFVWLILGGVFFVDATTTLIRRLLRGEKVYVAHRSHAYQWLARRWNSHLRVTLLVSAINICWLFPMAWLCLRNPNYAVGIVFLALGPLVIAALIAGAGKPESIVPDQNLPSTN